MASYYIDYENVHNEGLKGVQNLQQGDKLHLFYSTKADTLKIDVVRQLMECPADICFDKIVNGVENALDFQLITALMCNYDLEENYYIISRDKGYDAAIEMAGKQNRNNIYRCRDIDGAIKHQSGLSIDESDQEVIVDLGELSTDYEAPESAVAADDSLDKADNTLADASEAIVSDGVKPSLDSENDSVAEPFQELQEGEISADSAEICEHISSESAQEQNDQPEQDAQNQEAEACAENAAETPVEASALTEEEIKRRAHQSICTKILNHVKLIQKIPLVYKQAEEICEALEDSDSKMQFYHRLLQSMGRKKGGELYQKVKAVYKPIRGIYQASLTGEEPAEEGRAAVVAEAEPKNDNVLSEAQEAQSSETEVQEKPQRQARRGRPPRSAKTPRISKKRAKAEADSEALPAQQVEAVRAAFEQAEQQQGSAGEAILKMVELAKNI